MPAHRNRAKPAVCLPAVLAIGFSGHRHLENEARCLDAVRAFLRSKKDAHQGIVYGISSAASGGDQIFAEACLELGIPLRILLPRPAEQFRSDFDAAGWERSQAILQKAISLEVTTGSQDRNEQYYDCGIQTVMESQLLLALWDGEPSRGLGGTQEIVSFAEKTGHPVAWIHSRTCELKLINSHASAQMESRQELDFLNALPDRGLRQPEKSPQALAAAWLRKMDENANHFAPQARRLGSIPVVYTAAAAVLSGVAPEIPAAAPWLAVSAALGIVAMALPAALRLHSRQMLWGRTRTAAEIARAVQVLWNTPAPVTMLGPEVIPELAGMLRSLNFLKMQSGRGPGPSLQQFKREYRRDRVAHQAAYFSSQAERAERTARRYGAVSWICGILATLVAAAFLAGELHGIGARYFPARQWIALTMSGLFEIATMAGAFIAMKDSARRRRRYRELSRALARWDAELEALQTWGSVLQVAERVERALLAELLEWRSQLQSAAHHGK